MRVVWKIILLALLSSPAVAGEWAFELGSDIVHAKGLRLWSLSYENPNSRFRYGQFGQDGVDVEFFGAEYVYHFNKRWSASFGGLHLSHLTPLNGTYWNFQFGARYQSSKDVFVGVFHFSHGTGVGIEREKTNLGGTTLVVGTNF